MAGQAANISACIAASNAGGLNEACSEDSFNVKNTVNNKIAAQGTKFGLSGLPAAAPAPSASPSPSPSPTPTTNPNLAPAKTQVANASSALNAGMGQINQAYNLYGAAMSLPPNFSNPSVVNQIQQNFDSALGSLSSAANALSSARSSAQNALSHAQQLGNSQAASQAQSALNQISTAEGAVAHALNYANQSRQFSSGGVVRNQSAYALTTQSTMPAVTSALNYVNNAVGATQALQNTLNNIR